MTRYSGRCLCGKVTWQSEGPVLWAGHCHCESCRRACSATMASFFGVPRAGVRWMGDVQLWSSSKGVERGFCAGCGTQLFYRADRWPDEIHLYAASLDDPALFKPDAHYHWAERVPWLAVADELPKHAGSADN